MIINQTVIKDIQSLIDQSKLSAVRAVNREMTVLYWNIGKRLKEEILQLKRAEYGQKILQTVSAKLTDLYGKGFSERNLSNCISFYELFPELDPNLVDKLTWSHFVELLTLKDPLEREFYAEMTKLDNWSVRTLREKRGKLLYQRTAVSKRPQDVIKESLNLVKNDGKLSTDMILQDPYIMDFLNLPEHYTESDLETSILNEVSKFLLEIGVGFSFVARQKRISVGNDDFYIDLLLYNRLLKRLVVLELKTTKFKPSYKGQMEFYLNWLDQNEKTAGEEKPIGIILCAEKDEAQIKVFDLEASGIHIAKYLPVLPEQDVFERKIKNLLQTSFKEESKTS